jgi:transcriptional regulator with XRE-family HTH domain
MPDSSRDSAAGFGHEWDVQMKSLGAYIRAQRQLANLSLRQLAELTAVSNPYLSQIERGMHQPSVRVLRAIARALNLSAETLLAQAGLLDAGAPEDSGGNAVEEAIRADQRLSAEAKQALITVYRGMLNGPGAH